MRTRNALAVAFVGLFLIPAAPAQNDRISVDLTALPVEITKSGSYVVTKNFRFGDEDGNTNLTNGITVEASNVTIDLNGFTVTGHSGGDSGTCIFVSPNLENITIINGNIVKWGGDGIFAADSEGVVIRNVRVQSCDNGIITGKLSVIENCSVRGTTNGISIGTNSRIRGCVVNSNELGVVTSAGCTVTDCTVTENTIGISVCRNVPREIPGTGCRITNCIISDNKADGVELNLDGHVVRENTFMNNKSAAVLINGGANHIQHNMFVRNCYGLIEAAERDWGDTIENNIFRLNEIDRYPRKVTPAPPEEGKKAPPTPEEIHRDFRGTVQT